MRGHNPYDIYKKTKVETSNPAELITLLYDEAVKCCKLANKAIAENKLDVAHAQIVKAQDIVDELYFSVNKEQGGEIAENLLALYEYMKRRLIEANLKKDPEILEEVSGMISDLRKSWQEAIKIGAKGNG
ncbi:MAG TPA: flagellar export chaperone FliS [Firmicutes bacterium]|nr:flagellar export chaperone FliS [Bacillota bacterium]